MTATEPGGNPSGNVWPQTGASRQAATNLRSGSNRPAPTEVERARKKWTIAIVVASVILVLLLIGLGLVWFLGGDAQGAKSACTKASQDLTKQSTSLQETVTQAEQVISATDATQLSDPQLLQDLKLKSQQAGKVVKPLDCGAGLKKEQLASNASEMMATTEKLAAQQADLEDAISAVENAQNAKGLEQQKQELTDTVKQGDDLMKQAEEAKVDDTATLAALSAQLEDAKRLLEQVNDLKQVSDDKVGELNESMRAAKDRLDEDIAAVTKAITQKKEEQAKKDAEEQLKQLEQQRLEQERQASERAEQLRRSQSPSPDPSGNNGSNPNGTNGKKDATCTVGSTMTDAKGEQWKCVTILDSNTGVAAPTWVQEGSPQG